MDILLPFMTKSLRSPFRIPGRFLAGASALLLATSLQAVTYTDGEVREPGVVTTADTTEPLIIASGQAEQEGVISGGGSISKQGEGSLILSGVNTFTQGTFLELGTLRLGNSDALGNGLVTIDGGVSGYVALGTVNSGDIIMLENDVVINSDFAIDSKGADGAIEFFGSVNLGSANRTLTLTSEGLACFGGSIAGADGFSFVAGVGVVSTQAMLCSDTTNTFEGTLRVEAGVTLELEKVSDAIAISGDLLIDAGAEVQLWGFQQFSTDSNVEVNGLLSASSGGENTFNSLTGTGTVDGVNGDTLVVSSGSFSGTITDSLAIRKQGAGTLALSGANTYDGGTIVNGGTLRAQHNQALGTGGVTVSDGATLRVDANVRLGNAITIENDGATTYRKDFAEGESLTNFSAIRSSGPNQTEAQILFGEASDADTVEATFATAPSSLAANDVYRISDVFSLSGTGADTFVLQLSYTQTAYDAAEQAGLYTSELELVLGRLANGEWVSLGDGLFVEGAWNSFYTTVGMHGVDVDNNVVWAVTDQGGEISVVPEPSTWALFGVGLAVAVAVGFRRKVS